jgi:uridine kinase
MTEPTQLTLPAHPIVIAIGGCSGSGKTTLAAELSRQLDATLFPLDLYYRDLSQFPLDTRDKRNFDHPDSLESELILEHVRALANGQPIDRPVYDFKTHSRVPNAFDRIFPNKIVVVEGILALHYPELLPFYNLTIYVDAPNTICLRRRIYRDMMERGRTEESVREQFYATAHPMAEQYVIPSAIHAAVTVDGTESLDWSIERILHTLHSRKLL